MERASSPLVIIGIIVALLGVAGLAVPVFTTQKTTEVAKIGALDVQAHEDSLHVVPPMLAGGAVVLGVVVLGAGLYRRS